MILASIFDQLNALMYGFTKDAKSGKNRPKELSKLLIGDTDKSHKKQPSFSTGKDFVTRREQMLKKIRKEVG